MVTIYGTYHKIYHKVDKIAGFITLRKEYGFLKNHIAILIHS